AMALRSCQPPPGNIATRYRPGVTPLKMNAPLALTSAGATPSVGIRLRTGVSDTRSLDRSEGGLIESPSKIRRPDTDTPFCSVTVGLTSAPLTANVAVPNNMDAPGGGGAPRAPAPDPTRTVTV